MRKLAENISYLFCKFGYIEEKQINDIRFALEVVFSNLISFFTVLFIGIFINQLLLTSVFFLVFISFRLVDDRYHAVTFVGCLFLTVLAYLTSILIFLFFPINLNLWLFFSLSITNIILFFILYLNQSINIKSNSLLLFIELALSYGFSQWSLFLTTIHFILIFSNSIHLLQNRHTNVQYRHKY